VYLTHPECTSCKAIDPIFNNLAELALSRTDVLSFATMQCNKNDPPADVEVHNYPKIL
jgi:thiol-disulfide isomerase/thioredoxin